MPVSPTMRASVSATEIADFVRGQRQGQKNRIPSPVTILDPKCEAPGVNRGSNPREDATAAKIITTMRCVIFHFLSSASKNASKNKFAGERGCFAMTQTDRRKENRADQGCDGFFGDRLKPAPQLGRHQAALPALAPFETPVNPGTLQFEDDGIALGADRGCRIIRIQSLELATYGSDHGMRAIDPLTSMSACSSERVICPPSSLARTTRC
jgi:hypothetical protein